MLRCVRDLEPVTANDIEASCAQFCHARMQVIHSNHEQPFFVASHELCDPFHHKLFALFLYVERILSEIEIRGLLRIVFVVYPADEGVVFGRTWCAHILPFQVLVR